MPRIELSDKLFNIRGQFYPQGHVVAMLPSEAQARAAAAALTGQGTPSEDIIVLSPEDIRNNLGGSAEESDSPMPSPGTEALTSRRMVQMSDQGYWGLLIHSERSENDERMVEVLTKNGAPLAERYRLLVIEDLVQDVR